MRPSERCELTELRGTARWERDDEERDDDAELPDEEDDEPDRADAEPPDEVEDPE